MGVTGLWTVLHPCARPIKLETLNKKRLAVDASIWIYQFLKAVRDKEGNQLRNSHIVGFFRRICKLLFVGIKPVFVFDGGAPALKRQTITGRKRRREGRREDAARTAGKLLALQMQRLAEEEDAKRRDHMDDNVRDEGPLPDELVYVDELTMSPAERQKNRKFRKKDAYDLPELEVSMAEMGQPNDPRVMSLEELQQYAHQFNAGEDINVYDFSKIDFDSMFFQGLPPSDQYNILNAARLRSRLRMGYSKDQLDSMFPDRMAYSKFQIKRVTERNELTQRLMRLQGMSIDGTLSMVGTNRVAGEKGREYVLVKNDGVEGGWALGVVNTAGQKDKPIDIDELDKPEEPESEEESEEFEEVPIITMDMLPRLPSKQPSDATGTYKTHHTNQRRNFYNARGMASGTKRKAAVDPESLFVEKSDEEMEELSEQDPGLDPELQQAIALSLRQDHQEETEIQEAVENPVFAPQRRVEEAAPFFKARGMTIAHAANARALKSATKPASKPFVDDSDSDDDDIDFRKAVAQSQKKAQQDVVTIKPQEKPTLPKTSEFSGPLPFEKLDLGASLFAKKKPEVATAAEPDPDAGGFIVDDPATHIKTKKTTKTLPPWFVAPSEDFQLERESIHDKVSGEKEPEFIFETLSRPSHSHDTEVIDLESEDHSPALGRKSNNSKEEPIEILDSDDDKPSQRVSDRNLAISAKLKSVTPPRPTDETQISEPQTPQLLEQIHEEDDKRLTVSSVKSPTIVEPEDNEMEWEEVEVNALVTQRSHAGKENFDISIESPHLQERNGDDTRKTPALKDEINSMEFNAEDDDDDFNYSDPEEEEMFRQLAQEEEEHLRFASTLNNRSLASNMADFEEELKKLRVQQKKDMRDADEVTQTMITECQQLLALFGIPYITAPMEAEAQCAELVQLGLVDGVVTDDSDIFLFGGTRVFKNMFNQAKLVECYLTGDLESEFNLTRQRLIAISQLLGSDYTEGLPGVGPVTALEILSEFDTLEKFRDWWTAAQSGKITKAEDAMNGFKKKFRRNIKKLFLPSVFPDPRVEDAYLHPAVDRDPSEFVWGVPDLSALRAYLMANIGWSPERTDEILVPVIRDMNKRETEGTQSNITAFFGGTTGAGAFAPRRRDGGSNRLQSALQRIGNRAMVQIENEAADTAEEEVQSALAAKKKAKRQKKNN